MKKQVREIVKQVLIENENTRKDDFVLIYEVINKITGGYANRMMLRTSTLDMEYHHLKA